MKKALPFLLAVILVLTATAPVTRADHDRFCRLEYYDEYGRPVFHGYGYSPYSGHYAYHYHQTPASYREASRYDDEGDYRQSRRCEDSENRFDERQVVIIDRDDHYEKKHKKRKHHDDDRRGFDLPGPHRLFERLFR